jgi:hypothetical protein
MRAESGIAHVKILDKDTTAWRTGRSQESVITTKCLHHPFCCPKEVVGKSRSVLTAARVDILS